MLPNTLPLGAGSRRRLPNGEVQLRNSSASLVKVMLTSSFLALIAHGLVVHVGSTQNSELRSRNPPAVAATTAARDGSTEAPQASAEQDISRILKWMLQQKHHMHLCWQHVQAAT
jgi:hypothetical protein